MGTAGEVCSWIAAYMKVLIIYEGSQSNLPDLGIFFYMFPFFNGVIVIFCDPNQMGPVVLTNVQQAKEFFFRETTVFRVHVCSGCSSSSWNRTFI